MLLRRVLATATFLALLGASSAALVYPPTPVHAVVDHYFGHAVVDPYRWLENPKDPAVKAWAARQSALTLSYLRAQPSFPVYLKRVGALVRAEKTNRYGLQIAGGHYLYMRETPPQEQPVLVVRDGLHGAERVIFDPQANVPKGQAAPAIESVYLSFDGSKVAFTTQPGGSENETIHVVDTATGTLAPDTLPDSGGGTSPNAVLWDGNGNGFLHTQWPHNPDGSVSSAHIEIWHHTLGTDPSTDMYVFGRGLSPRAEYHLLGSADGKYQAAFETDGDGVHGSIYERTAGGTFTRVVTPDAGVGDSGDAHSAYVGDRLVVISRKRASAGEAIGLDPGATFAQGKVLVPAGPLVIDEIVPVHGGFLTSDLDGGDAVARFFGADGSRATLPLPPQSTLTEAAADLSGHDIIVGYVGYGTPNTWLRYDAAHSRLVPTGIAETAPAADFSKFIVRRALVPSLDGLAKIPVETVSLPGVKTDGTAPTILYAYGAYGIVTQPFFLGTYAAFLERGGVFAQAMIRGGGEYGEAWHLAAVHATKYKSSDDLAAVAGWLGTHGYGNAKHLGIMGGSAGGYLMGLALTRNPDRYRAVDSSVGIYDQLRFELTPNGAYNTPEFGTVKDPAQFAFMLKLSPYEHVVKGRAYPAVLMTTGENDPRVDPYNSRKMIARLQAASSSGYPVLLWQKSGEGHGFGNSLDQLVNDRTATLTWFESQLR